jgi:hypothetical protein
MPRRRRRPGGGKDRRENAARVQAVRAPGERDRPGGAFVNALLAFLIIAAVTFVSVVKPMNAVPTRMRTEPTPDASIGVTNEEAVGVALPTSPQTSNI